MAKLWPMIIIAATLLLSSCMVPAAKPVYDFVGTEWESGDVVTLSFLDYDLIYFFQNGSNTDYTPKAATNYFTLSSDNPSSDYFGIETGAAGATPQAPIQIGEGNAQFGTWTYDGSTLTLNFESYNSSAQPPAATLYTIKFAVSFTTDYQGNKEFSMTCQGWEPIDFAIE